MKASKSIIANNKIGSYENFILLFNTGKLAEWCKKYGIIGFKGQYKISKCTLQEVPTLENENEIMQVYFPA